MVPRDALIQEARDWEINLIERDNPHWNHHGARLLRRCSWMAGTVYTPAALSRGPEWPGHDEAWVCSSAVGPHVSTRKRRTHSLNLSRARKAHTFDQYAWLAAELRFFPESRAKCAGEGVIVCVICLINFAC